MQTECSSLAAWKMEAGPPGADRRISSQATRRCVGISSYVVNGPGKGEFTRQVRARKANGSEPQMFCRKTLNRRLSRADYEIEDLSLDRQHLLNPRQGGKRETAHRASLEFFIRIEILPRGIEIAVPHELLHRHNIAPAFQKACRIHTACHGRFPTRGRSL